MSFPRTDNDKPTKTARTECSRCGGEGGWSGWPGFTCFRCSGNGIDPTYREWAFPATWTDAECQYVADVREDRNTRRREKAQAKRQAKREDRYAANIEKFDLSMTALTIDGAYALLQNDRVDEDGYYRETKDRDPETVILDRKIGRSVETGRDVLRKAWEFDLSDKQADMLRNIAADITKGMDEAKAELEAKSNVPAWEMGKQEIEGEVIKTEVRESDFGQRLVWVVKTDDGRVAWGSVPTKLPVPDTGDRVRFTANVNGTGDDDPTFGFYRLHGAWGAENLTTTTTN